MCILGKEDCILLVFWGRFQMCNLQILLLHLYCSTINVRIKFVAWRKKNPYMLIIQMIYKDTNTSSLVSVKELPAISEKSHLIPSRNLRHHSSPFSSSNLPNICSCNTQKLSWLLLFAVYPSSSCKCLNSKTAEECLNQLLASA